MEKRGRAYGFFYSRLPKSELATALQEARKHPMASTPSDLELTLDYAREVQGERKVEAFAKRAVEDGCNYMVTATYPPASNQKTASELGDILNAAYASDRYGPEGFIGGIRYKAWSFGPFSSWKSHE